MRAPERERGVAAAAAAALARGQARGRSAGESGGAAAALAPSSPSESCSGFMGTTRQIFQLFLFSR